MSRRLFVFCLSGVLLISGCKSQATAFLPVTGEKNIAPDTVESARKNVLNYVVSATRLPTLQQDVNWELETTQRSQNRYNFRSGDWRLIIWLADSNGENQRVVILNQVNHAAWTGYVTPAGEVVDTCYIR